LTYHYKEGDLVFIPTNTTLVQLSGETPSYVSAVKETKEKYMGIVKTPFDGTYCRVMILGQGIWSVNPRHISIFEGVKDDKAS
jgi:hypothetical protein